METMGTWWMWAGFFAIVLVMLAVDLFVVGGGKAAPRVAARGGDLVGGLGRASRSRFAGALWWYLDGTAGREAANATALEFVTGYLIEKSLAVDNVFVWLMLFSFFARAGSSCRSACWSTACSARSSCAR